jgi:hypothetical protein
MLTLLEASKTLTNPLDSAVVEIYAKENPILGVLPFMGISGNAYRYNREDTLPGIGFRGVNESYTESTGVLNPLTEALAIAGGDLDVDTFIVQTEGGARRAIETSMKLKALSLAWAATFFKGDSVANPAAFDGLQRRLVGTQLIPNGATANGNALSLANLDQAIDQTYSATHLAMSKAMRRRLTQATRNTSVGGVIAQATDAFGRQITTYNGLPILEIDVDNTNTQILGFTETNPGGGTATGTSIYVLSLGLDTLFGIQNGLPRAKDLGEQQSKPAFRTRVEWFSAFTVRHPRAATRLWGISNAAVVA